jgi:beta-glucosidase
MKRWDWTISLYGNSTPDVKRNEGRKVKKSSNSSAIVEDKVKDLLSKMTVEEKVAQLGSVFATPLLENGKFASVKTAAALKNGIGHISAPALAANLPPREVAALINDIQKYLTQNTRLGIPAIIHEECLNGFRAKGATIFPQNIGLASTWEPDLIGRITEVIRKQMRATGVHQGLAPVLDVTRDPRWGRVEETFGEDPYLVARMGVAYVRGLQGDDIKQGIVATLKHFAGHGLPEGGLNSAPSHIPPRLFREVYLYPFEKAVKEGGVLSVMNAYHEIDGIPCGASEELLTGILRREWGFDGVVVSDYFAIAQLMTTHKIAAQLSDAAALSLNAGLDVELPFTNCYGEPLLEAVKKGAVTMATLDLSVSRLLTLKFKLGLFENPYVNPEATVNLIDTPADRELALEAAHKSIILLKNDKSLLPLDKNIRSIAVIGPNADSQRNLLGDYTFPSHSAYEIKKDEKTGDIGLIAKVVQEGMVAAPKVVSILEGIKATVNKKTKVIYAKGCEVKDASKDGFDEAVKAARSAEVAVVVVGDKSGLMPDNTSGEMRDRDMLNLPGVQEELVKAIYETGTPVVLVLVNGRPYTMKWLAEKIPAIVNAWEPGEEGGRAVADVLFGDYNPGGKLPTSFPLNEGQIPTYYGHKPSGRKSSPWMDYVDGNAKPLFEFGYGLSYTTFEFSNLKIEPVKIPSDGTLKIKVDVKNTGKREGDEVVQLYINDIVASVTRPVKELKGFERIHLKPGEEKSVTFHVQADQLAFYNKNMERKVEPGVFKVMVGRSSADILLEGEFEVTG